jgi:hypothetical protein
MSFDTALAVATIVSAVVPNLSSQISPSGVARGGRIHKFPPSGVTREEDFTEMAIEVVTEVAPAEAGDAPSHLLLKGREMSILRRLLSLAQKWQRPFVSYSYCQVYCQDSADSPTLKRRASCRCCLQHRVLMRA